MELKEAINKLFEMTDEQRHNLFGISNAEDILNNYSMTNILKRVESLCTEPKYGDVYENKDYCCKKLIFLNYQIDCNSSKHKVWVLHTDNETPQLYNMSTINERYIKTGKNVADKLKDLFK